MNINARQYQLILESLTNELGLLKSQLEAVQERKHLMTTLEYHREFDEVTEEIRGVMRDMRKFVMDNPQK